MLRRLALWALLGCLVAPTTVLAQETITFSGRYTIGPVSWEEREIPGGRTIRTATFTKIFLTDDTTNPFNNMTADCVGTGVVSDEDTLIAGGGFCFLTGTDGDGCWMWYRSDGSHGIYNGFGKFEGLTGGGTFEVVALFSDGERGGVAVWEGTYERR